MKDNFSSQSEDYSRFRPNYPTAMIDYIMGFVGCRSCALDVATGNGQVASLLSPYFDRVFATNISARQLENAIMKPNILYRQQLAEHTDFDDNCFNLITVAQAIHWLAFDDFYSEVYRILRPDGIFAVLGYGLLVTNPDSDAILNGYYQKIVGPYWDPERKYIDAHYQTIPFPFEEIKIQSFENQFVWTLDQLVGYLKTWSATQHHKEETGTDPIALIYDELKISWGKSDRKVTFPLFLRMGTLK